jgi:predicted small lipoprotein YifL
MRRAAFAFLFLAAGCGQVEPLQPPAGEPLPPAPATAARAPTTDEMLTPPPIARPTRTEDTLRRSEEREDDRFDLPPT